MWIQACAAALATLAQNPDPQGAVPDPRPDDAPWTERLAGGAEVRAVNEDGTTLYRAGRVSTETRIPVGYPRPTPPGALELKHIPSVRRAEFTSPGDDRTMGMRGFMPLFRHISTNDIAMTAPVEMEQRDTDADGSADAWTMTFLYHSTDNGPTGTDGPVEVVDTEPQTWLALGIEGRPNPADWDELEATLDEWLDAQDEWARRSEPRFLGYNGPYVPIDRQWWEIQVRVERTPPADRAD